jgi:hypothetical protein
LNEYSEIFDKVGCLYIGNLLSKEESEQALLKLFISKENGQHVTDGMGYEISFSKGELNYLCEKIRPTLEKILDKKLSQTYSYARIYKHGDELEIHTDRTSCEVSVSITLGYGGESIWPFCFMDVEHTKPHISFVDGIEYFGEKIEDYDPSHLQKIEIGIGDAILYKGMEVAHGRKKYEEGLWQAQVFLHFVDLNGLNANHANDVIVVRRRMEDINGTRN